MAKSENEKSEKVHVETSILPLKYVDLVEDIFHAVLAIALLVIGIGASLTLESGKSNEAFDRAIMEMGLNALIVVALVFAIFLSKNAHRKR